MSTINTQPSTDSEVNEDLQDYFVDQYLALEDQNIFTNWPGEPIKVDDQESTDVDHLFCKITVTVSDHEVNQFELNLSNAPFTEDLGDEINEGDAEINYNEAKLRAGINIIVSTRDVTYIRNLAKAYRRTTGRGADYLDRNWIWVCRRTADSLDRLASNIMEFRKQRRG
jgi:hypothetical protein